ncbi:MAG: helix-turn-helix domain-containing protein [Candidatus Magasanikbacteria bacterium]
MIEQQLQQIGFHKNEVKVYLALFETGKARAGKIIEYTGLHRNLVYTALEELEKRGLISKVEASGVAEFSANDPRVLLDEIDEQKITAKEIVDALKEKNKAGSREIAVYEGIEGVKRARNKTLQYGESKGETLYVMGGSKRSTMPELESYWRSYHHKREQAGINFKILFDRDTPGEMLDWRNRLALSQAKYFPFDLHSPTQVGVFRDLVDISIPGLSPLTFVIKNDEIAKGFKQYFEYFWNQSVRVETGLSAVKTAIYNMLGELSSGEEYFVLGAAVGMKRAGEIGQMYDQFHADRIKKQVIVNMLANSDNYDEIVERNHKFGDPKDKFSNIKKFISAPPTPMQVNMYHGKCFFILYGDMPAVIYFEQSEITKVFKNYFDYFWNQDTYVLRGPEAYGDLWMEAVAAGELRYIGARGYFLDNFPKQWAELKAKTALNKKFIMKNIVDPGVRGHEITKLPYAQTKYLLSSAKNPNVVWLYGNKVVAANWSEIEPVFFVSKNKALAQSYNDYFDELWGKDSGLPKKK